MLPLMLALLWSVQSAVALDYNAFFNYTFYVLDNAALMYGPNEWNGTMIPTWSIQTRDQSSPTNPLGTATLVTTANKTATNDTFDAQMGGPGTLLINFIGTGFRVEGEGEGTFRVVTDGQASDFTASNGVLASASGLAPVNHTIEVSQGPNQWAVGNVTATIALQTDASSLEDMHQISQPFGFPEKAPYQTSSRNSFFTYNGQWNIKSSGNMEGSLGATASMVVPDNTSLLTLDGQPGLGVANGWVKYEPAPPAGVSTRFRGGTESFGPGLFHMAALDPTVQYTLTVGVEDKSVKAGQDYITFNNATFYSTPGIGNSSTDDASENSAKGSDGKRAKGPSTGVIAGAAVGAVLGTGLIGAAVFLCLRSRRKARAQPTQTPGQDDDVEEKPEPDMVVTPYELPQTDDRLARSTSGSSERDLSREGSHHATQNIVNAKLLQAQSTSYRGASPTSPGVYSSDSSSTERLPRQPSPRPPRRGPIGRPTFTQERDAGVLIAPTREALPPSYAPPAPLLQVSTEGDQGGASPATL